MSDFFTYRDDNLFVEDLPLSAVASAYGTPCYVYSKSAIETHWRAFDQAFSQSKHLICYAVKANSNLAILNLLARMGSGFDIVSAGELERVLKAGGEAGKIVFSGVGKSRQEMKRALDAGVKCFNVESIAELHRLNEVALESGKQAPVSIRVNPDVDAKTHPYISTGLKENKFGIAFEQALEGYLLAKSMDGLDVVGIDCHIGSQITETSPFADALTRIMGLVSLLADNGIELSHIDIGGGLGIDYEGETIPSAVEYAQAVLSTHNMEQYEIIMEPGRAIVGNAGVLLTCVEYLKNTDSHHFAIVDAAMNDLLRPSLYSAFHEILPLNKTTSAEDASYDIVGPVCETGDFLGKSRSLALEQGDVLAVMSAGAYGFTMSSNYNTRPRAAEIMIDGKTMHEIRQRESIQELFSGESILP